MNGRGRQVHFLSGCLGLFSLVFSTPKLSSQIGLILFKFLMNFSPKPCIYLEICFNYNIFRINAKKRFNIVFFYFIFYIGKLNVFIKNKLQHYEFTLLTF